MKKKSFMLKHVQIFDIINYSILFILLIIVLYPLYFVFIASFSNPWAVHMGRVWLLPAEITFEGYEKVFMNKNIWRGYSNSLFYMILGTAINVFVTVPAGYALSRSDLKGRKAFTIFMTFTMFFSGGLIPTFLLVRNLGMYDTFWAMVLPNALMVFNLIICRSLYENTLPENIFEAASIDGCSNMRYFIHIALPLSKTIVMVMVLFYAVNHWNSYFEALIYLRNSAKYPLQIILRDILISNESGAMDTSMNDESVSKQQRIAEIIKYCVIVFANIPLIALYPMIQRYFKKGVMIGALKG